MSAADHHTQPARSFTSLDELEKKARVGAQSLALQWLTLLHAIGIMRALAERQAQLQAKPAPLSLPATEPTSTTVEDRYVVPGVGFSWDGDV